MSKARIAITVPQEVLAQAKKAVRSRRSASVSAYFAESAASRWKEDELRRLLEDMVVEHGRPTAEAYQWARRVLGQ